VPGRVGGVGDADQGISEGDDGMAEVFGSGLPAAQLSSANMDEAVATVKPSAVIRRMKSRRETSVRSRSPGYMAPL
jgi:hypothetical protein